MNADMTGTDKSSIEPLGIDNVLFSVRTLGDSVSFYERLGFALRFRLDKQRIALFEIGAERPGLVMREESDASSGHFWVEVRNADTVTAELARLGIKYQVLDIPTGRTVEVRDPSGNVVGFAYYRTRPDLAR